MIGTLLTVCAGLSYNPLIDGDGAAGEPNGSLCSYLDRSKRIQDHHFGGYLRGHEQRCCEPPDGEVFAVIFDNCIYEKKERRGRRLASYGVFGAASLAVSGISWRELN